MAILPNCSHLQNYNGTPPETDLCLYCHPDLTSVHKACYSVSSLWDFHWSNQCQSLTEWNTAFIDLSNLQYDSYRD